MNDENVMAFEHSLVLIQVSMSSVSHIHAQTINQNPTSQQIDNEIQSTFGTAAAATIAIFGDFW